MRHRLDCDDDCDNGCEPEGDGKDKKKETGLAQELLKHRVLIVSEEISEKLAQSFYAQLLLLEARSSEEPITVYINSPGGDADSGFGMYDMLRFVEAPVTTVCCGLCASAAVLVFLAADEGRNLCLPNARFLIHQPSTGIRGTASDIQITAEEIMKTRRRYNEIVSGTTGKPVEELEELSRRDFWLGPQEAKEFGLVYKIVASKKDLPQ